MSRIMPDLSGFEVVRLPSVEERLALPWGRINSIPEGHLFLEDDRIITKYKYKLRVFKRDHQDWRLDIREIAESEFGGSHKTQQEALTTAWEYLSHKPL